jgi:hypothetical protein
MEYELRICSYCGGQESWTYVDPYAPWEQGYTFDNHGCATGNCNEEYTCYNGGPK